MRRHRTCEHTRSTHVGQSGCCHFRVTFETVVLVYGVCVCVCQLRCLRTFPEAWLACPYCDARGISNLAFHILGALISCLSVDISCSPLKESYPISELLQDAAVSKHCSPVTFGVNFVWVLPEDYCRKGPRNFNTEMFVTKVGNPYPTLGQLPASRILYVLLVGEKQYEIARTRFCTELLKSWSTLGQFLANSPIPCEVTGVFLAVVLWQHPICSRVRLAEARLRVTLLARHPRQRVRGSGLLCLAPVHQSPVSTLVVFGPALLHDCCITSDSLAPGTAIAWTEKLKSILRRF